MKQYVVPLIVFCGLAGPALAQQQGHDMSSMPGMKASASDTASTKAYKASMAKMHKAMAVTYTGDPDVDFLRSMMPHHQGAIDMAKIVIAHGKDPDVRKLAQTIVADQEREIGEMQAMLKRLGK